MAHEATLALYDRQLRQNVRTDSATARVEWVGGVVRHVGSEDDWNGVVWSDLTAATADAEIAAQVEYFASLGLEFEWKHYSHDQPADLAGRLLAAGFAPEPPETLMVARISELPTAVELPEGVRVETVTDAAGVDLVAAVHEQAFGTSAERLRKRMLAQLVDCPETVTMTVAMAGDEPVCSSRMEVYPGTDFAGLWGGGTVPAWRGRGIYRALVAHRAGIAAAQGHRYLQVDASDQSRPILQRLGFAALSVTTPYVREVRS